MGAKKSLGQNFLRDPKILNKIVNFAQINKSDTVLEVGPGEGTLTKLLVERAERVVAVEKDEKLAEQLGEKFKSQILNSKLEVICGDILKIENLLEIAKLKIENYVLIGNIPYYITGALFKKFLESANPPQSITFVVQKEVADRIMARDGKESILSISIKAYGAPEYGGLIKAGSFSPAPKVDSAIIAVRDINKGRFKNDLTPTPLLAKERGEEKNPEKTFFEIVKAGFAHKRKLLIKNLLSSPQNMSRGTLDSLSLKEVFEKCGIPEKARAEDLKVEDWLSIASEILI